MIPPYLGRVLELPILIPFECVVLYHPRRAPSGSSVKSGPQESSKGGRRGRQCRAALT